MTASERAPLIAAYREGYASIVKTLEKITPAELDFKIAPKKWSCREIVLHLADTETISGYRLQRLLTEHAPYIAGFDQDVYAQRFQYASRPIEPALATLKTAIDNTLQIVDTMSEADWRRTGEHAESGPYSPVEWLKGRASHVRGHAEQILRNREAFAQTSTSKSKS
jgi:hypothetical protein